MTEVHAEIQYQTEAGTWVHSDICPAGCNSENMSDKKWREFIHLCLDEWIEKSNGTGIFYIKQDDYKHFNDELSNEMLKDMLSKCLISSCSCVTKSPEVEFHKPYCLYRRIKEIINFLD